jgi:predicted aspartyl protease
VEYLIFKSIQKGVLRSLSGLLACSTVACHFNSASETSPQPSSQPTFQATAESRQAQSLSLLDDPYKLGVSKASSALSISQTAQSQEDWNLVAIQWQQAIALLRRVPPSHPNYNQAQAKMSQYQNALAKAQKQAATLPHSPDSIGDLPNPVATRSTVVVLPGVAPKTTLHFPNPSPSDQQMFQTKIKHWDGGIPVIDVTFNDNYQFEMVVDTGASSTLITQQMAAILDIKPVRQIAIDTASEKGVVVPQGYLRSVEVGGVAVDNVLVSIAKPDLDTGLLGHDFFGNFDVTIRQNTVEFRLRQ